MPTVKIKGKIKKFPYNKKGKIMAQMAAKQVGAVIDTEVKPKVEAKLKSKNRFGISNLKKGSYS